MPVRKSTYISKKTGKPGWVCDYKDSAGKRHQEAFDTKKAADSRWAEVQGQLQQGIQTGSPSTLTIKDAYDFFMAAITAEGAAPATIANHRTFFKNHINPLLGSKRLSTLTPASIHEYLDELRNTGRSADMASRCKKTLGAIIDEAVRTGRAAANPVRSLRARRRMRRKEIEARTASYAAIIPERGDVRALLEGADSRMAWIIVIGSIGDDDAVLSARITSASRRIKDLYATRKSLTPEQRATVYSPAPWLQTFLSCIALAGLRPGEARGLTWGAIDLDGGYIDVSTAADGYGNLGSVKTAAAVRRVPIGPILSSMLRAWRKACPDNDFDLVFATKGTRRKKREGTPDAPPLISLTNIIRRDFQPLQICLGLVGADGTPRYTAHKLRHFAVSLWIDEGADIKQISQWVGHESVSFTMDVYGHLFRARALDRTHVIAGEISVLGKEWGGAGSVRDLQENALTHDKKPINSNT